MVGIREHNTKGGTEERLETPRVVGYRNGMTPVGLIGRRLASVYGIAGDIPRDMGTLIQNLDRRGSCR